MGRRIIIIEDEWLIASAMEQALTDAGMDVVGIRGTIGSAARMIRKGGFDAAILDANLGGATAEPLAQMLRAHALPFVVVSGYGQDQGMPLPTGVPVLKKPFEMPRLIETVLSLDDT